MFKKSSAESEPPGPQQLGCSDVQKTLKCLKHSRVYPGKLTNWGEIRQKEKDAMTKKKDDFTPLHFQLEIKAFIVFLVPVQTVLKTQLSENSCQGGAF